ncbi:MAG: hypothetical protein KDH96_08925, partial [Candidatus Riesia sp.]|nr:hypothetical protein [Candidatus Riesia sp.]
MPSRAELVNRANVMGLDPANYPNDSKLEQKIIYLETNASTMAGTLATGTLTQSGAATDGDQVEIGGITYEYLTALSEKKASTTLTSDTTNVSEGDTVTIEGVTYTFRATPVNPYDVDIGASAAASLDNLKAAINDSGTEGTTYGTDTAAHPRVTATTNTDTTQVVEAINLGSYANDYLVSTTSAHLSWDGTTFTDGTPGVDPIPYEVLLTGVAATELDNLKQAINAGDTENGLDGEGTNWS